MSSEQAPTVMALVRADRANRPLRDATQVDALRDALRDWRFDAPRTVRPSDFRGEVSGPGHGSALLRGVVVGRVFAMHVAGYQPTHPFREAMESLVAEGQHTLLDAWRALSPDERARLRAECDAHIRVLGDTVGAIAPSWMPRGPVATSVRIGAHLHLRDSVDLVLGDLNATTSSVALIDVTTAGLNDYTDRIARFHALTHTLRTGVPPYCVAFLSTATGEIRRMETTNALEHARHELADVLFTQEEAA